MPPLLKPGVGSAAAGHNLLEVVLASFILSTVLIFVAGLWAVYHQALGKSKDLLVATSLARSVLEEKMAAGYSALDSIVGTPVDSKVVSHSQVRGRRVDVTYDVHFLATDSTALSGMRRLSVTLDWEEPTGKRTLTYETAIFRTQ